MAKQTINQGAAPTGAGGDTFRSGSAKLQANDDELYNYLGDGTNLNKLGTAAFKNTGTQAGNVMEVGAFGLGTELVNTLRSIDSTSKGTGFFGIGQELLFGVEMSWNINGTAIQLLAGIDDRRLRYRHKHGGQGWVDYVVYTAQNTTVDPNGFLKNASPIVQLFADKIELNDESQQQNIEFEKLGIGDYLIKNSSGFAQEGWYVEQPKDANGNIYHAIVYDTLENGDISVKTYEQKLDGVKIVVDLDKPVDIKENRFISIRLNELPSDTSAPQNPTIVDNEGNPAPSYLHEHEEGVWVISDDNAEILLQESRAAMAPLTRRQFRLALVMQNISLDLIDDQIAAIPDAMQRQITTIEWQDATEFHRTSTTLNNMASLLNLSQNEVDILWNFALSL